jgi:hypothetical protein
VKSFDERSEAASQERRGQGNDPSPQEIRAVQKALTSRTRQLHDSLSSLDVLLHLDGHGDASDGPPTPGTLGNQRVIERFKRVAAEIRNVRDKVADVDFNAGDKQKFKASLNEAALSWDARARGAQSSDPDVIAATEQAMRQHDVQAATHRKALRPYFTDQTDD